MTDYLAYIDESGDPNFNEKASDIFFLGAVIMEKNDIDLISKKLNEIKQRHRLGELKSSRIRSFDRRLTVLDELSKLDIKCLSVWVKKRELKGEWFQYKRSFYKYVQRLLNHEIYKLFRNTSVTLHRFGSKEYQESLLKYLKDHLQGELFGSSIAINNTTDEELIQLADFFNGTLRKVLTGDFNHSEKNQILALLEPKWAVKVVLPDDGKYVNTDLVEEDDNYLGYFVNETKRFLERKQNIDPAKKLTLEYLYHTALLSPNDYVYTDEILNWLNNFNIHFSKEQFRNLVTASLRDEGLIIVGTRKGLKLPTRVEDILDYIEFSVGQVLPTLKRLRRAITLASAHPKVPDLNRSLSDEMRAILQRVNA